MTAVAPSMLIGIGRLRPRLRTASTARAARACSPSTTPARTAASTRASRGSRRGAGVLAVDDAGADGVVDEGEQGIAAWVVGVEAMAEAGQVVDPPVPPGLDRLGDGVLEEGAGGLPGADLLQQLHALLAGAAVRV